MRVDRHTHCSARYSTRNSRVPLVAWTLSNKEYGISLNQFLVSVNRVTFLRARHTEDKVLCNISFSFACLSSFSLSFRDNTKKTGRRQLKYQNLVGKYIFLDTARSYYVFDNESRQGSRILRSQAYGVRIFWSFTVRNFVYVAKVLRYLLISNETR